MGCRASTAVAVRPSSFAQVVPDDLPPPCRQKVSGLSDDSVTSSNPSSQRPVFYPVSCFEEQLKNSIDQEVSDQQAQAGVALEQAEGVSELARGGSSSSQAPDHDLSVSVEAKPQILGVSHPNEKPPAVQLSSGAPRLSQPEDASEQRGQQAEHCEKEGKNPEQGQQPKHREEEGRQQIQLQRLHEDRAPEHSEKMVNKAPLGGKGMEEDMMTKVDTSKSGSLDAKSRKVGMAAVSEPKGLVTYQSYHHNPTAEDFAAGHPIASCGPNHRKHQRRLRKYLKSIVSFPQSFNDRVAARRQKMDERRKRQDALLEESLIMDLVQDEASAEAEARGRPDSPILDESMPRNLQGLSWQCEFRADVPVGPSI